MVFTGPTSRAALRANNMLYGWFIHEVPRGASGGGLSSSCAVPGVGVVIVDDADRLDALRRFPEALFVVDFGRAPVRVPRLIPVPPPPVGVAGTPMRR